MLHDLDDKELKAAAETIRLSGLTRNTISVADFAHFAPLFAPPDEVPHHVINRLSKEFDERFNRYAPITVRLTDEPDSPVHKIVPALLTPLRTVNEIGEGDTLERFSNQLAKSDNPLRTDLARAAYGVRQILPKLRNVAAEEEVHMMNRDLPDDADIMDDDVLDWE